MIDIMNDDNCEHLIFQTDAIKEASLKCNQKKDQMDRKNKEVGLRKRKETFSPSNLIIKDLFYVYYCNPTFYK